MHIRSLFISIAGFLFVALPANATLSFSNGSGGATSFTNALTSESLTLVGPITFSGSGGGEYSDHTTGINFFDDNNSGVNADTFSISAGVLVEQIPGDVFGITLPSNILAFETTVAVQTGNFASLCIGPGGVFGGTCTSPPDYSADAVLAGSPEVLTAIQSAAPGGSWTIFIAGGTAGNGKLGLASFEVGELSTAPEPSTTLLLGGGLVLTGLLRRVRS
jgi:PEP-CTERM motif